MDDNTFECPNCGAKIYPEMTRCPQCGHNMYPEDEEQLTSGEEAEKSTWLYVFGTVVIGWLIACGIPMLLHFIVARFQTPASLSLSSKVVLWLAGPIGALVGGYVAASIARPHARWMGGVVAVLAIPVNLLFTTHWVLVNPAFLLNPWVLASGILTLLAGVFGGWLSYKLIQDTGWKDQWKVRGWEDLLYQDLLRKVRFNGSIADRLIDFERKQDPQASRLKLIQSAIERWERDNR